MYPSSTVRLLSGVPLSNDYKNQLTFTNASNQQSYFIGKSKYTISEMNYVREGGMVHVPYNYDDLIDVNYIMYQNHQYSSKWFYAFVTRKEYVDPTSARIYFEIDVFQTWQFEFDFKPSFVEREHLPISQIGSPSNPLHPNTIDEGLDYGSDMDIKSIERYRHNGGMKWLVIVSKNVMHGANVKKAIPSVIATPQPLSYYLVPFYDDGSDPQVSVNGNGLAVQTAPQVLKAMYQLDDSINNIVSLYVTEDIGLAYEMDGVTARFINTDSQKIDIAQISGKVTDSEGNETDAYFNALYVEKAFHFYKRFASFERTKWEGIDVHKETKLLQYPYVQFQITDFRGNIIDLKPQFLTGDTIRFNYRGSLGLSNKIQIGVEGYNLPIQNNVYSEMLTGFITEDPQDIPIISDSLGAFLQGNRNSINNQVNQMEFNAGMNAVGSVTSVLTSANKLDAFNNAVGGVQSAGNSYYDIKGISAKQQDISNVPPSLSKQGSNINFTVGQGLEGLFLIKRQIKPEYQERLFQFFNMYGYQVNTVKVPYLKSRSKWNYVKTRNAYLTGNIPNDQLSILSNLFDNGITLWHTSDVGNYGADNYV